MSLETMSTRLKHNGGNDQQDRMIESKLKSLKKALLYSYQAAVITLSDGREFRCLINPDKLKNNYDDKIVSIPFEDICLNSESKKEVSIGMKAGDVFTWKDNGSKWLVFLQRLEELAYFRAEIRRCAYETEIGKTKYSVYVRGPEETDIIWKKSNDEMYNEKNYGLVMYITKNEETLSYLKRFAKLTLNNKQWEVQAVDNISVEGIIEVSLKETYSNTIEQALEQEKVEQPTEIGEKYIKGAEIVYPYGEEEYSIVGLNGGIWKVSDNKKVKIINQTQEKVFIEIITGKSGNFEIIYETDAETITLPIEIESL